MLLGTKRITSGAIEVEIDVDDLIEEYEDEIVGSITDADLEEECESRGWYVDKDGFSPDENQKNLDDYHCLHKLYYNKEDLRRLICDICETSYHEPVDKLLENLKERLA